MTSDSRPVGCVGAVWTVIGLDRQEKVTPMGVLPEIGRSRVETRRLDARPSVVGTAAGGRSRFVRQAERSKPGLRFGGLAEPGPRSLPLPAVLALHGE